METGRGTTGREATVLIEEQAELEVDHLPAIEADRRRGTEADRRAVGRMACAAVDQIGRDAEAHPVEIATGREWAERTIPPDWWMDRSHCRGNVQRQE
jgi:hypothetical protein